MEVIEASAGDEWTDFDQNTWVYLGSHPHNDASVSGAIICNYNADATEDDGCWN